MSAGQIPVPVSLDKKRRKKMPSFVKQNMASSVV
jgi:hypothetical protein